MAAFALISWPLIALAIFAALGPARGLIWSVTFGYLFLPEGYGFDLPGLPSYDKFLVLTLSSLLGTFLFGGRAKKADVTLADRTFRLVISLLLVVLVLSTVPTYMQNNFPIMVGGRSLPPSVPQDIISTAASYLILFIPFLLAKRYLILPEHHVDLLYAIAAGAVVYTFLVLFEMRMSPQLNNWIYGYFPHSWLQHLRGGGYRPIVFLNHGLWVGFILLMAVLAAIGVARDGTRMQRGTALLGATWIFLVLSVSHNLGATLIGIMLIPAALFMSVRGQVRIAMIVSVIFLSYPLIKQATSGPVEQFRQTVAVIAPERAASLEVRLSNEDQLLERANLKPAFGWGGWGRALIYNEHGRRLSITDGLWIIQFGKAGWVGYLGYFGLLVFPIVFMRRAMRRKEAPVATGALALIATANFIYMIPNATLTPVCMLVFGALAAFVQFDTKQSDVPAEGTTDPNPQQSRTPRYSRFGPDHAPGYRRP